MKSVSKSRKIFNKMIFCKVWVLS